MAFFAKLQKETSKEQKETGFFLFFSLLRLYYLLDTRLIS